MTEQLPHAAAEEQRPPHASPEHLGEAAVHASGEPDITMQDIVEVRSQRLRAEFDAFEKEHDYPSSDPLIAPLRIHHFIRNKVEAMQHELPADREVHTLPEVMVMAHLRQLRQERDSNPRTSQRPTFMRAQKIKYMPALARYADDYPEIHFSILLRNEFQANDEMKNAMYVSELLIATGRTIDHIRKFQTAAPLETDGV